MDDQTLAGLARRTTRNSYLDVLINEILRTRSINPRDFETQVATVLIDEAALRIRLVAISASGNIPHAGHARAVSSEVLIEDINDVELDLLRTLTRVVEHVGAGLSRDHEDFPLQHDSIISSLMGHTTDRYLRLRHDIQDLRAHPEKCRDADVAVELLDLIDADLHDCAEVFSILDASLATVLDVAGRKMVGLGPSWQDTPVIAAAL